ncbi:MAG: quinone oxidoreductase [Candidatus Contendobacter odensis]|uniref:NADPH:quinone reductase n=1 Tax=Candidatus Contendibacter odensensis TaxID=1400860 RepID=A0A2G6PGQ5_9GAMM|nr:MAG: quinone oxidoreductase [Candidatus Contendobacter odensis]
MSKAICIHQYGGPEVLCWEEVEVGEPDAGQIKIRHRAVGLNYIDVYHRTGLYPLPSLPWTPGMEAAGYIEALGEGVTNLKVGDHVAYASPPVGAYAETRIIPADRVVVLPGTIDDQTAAAMMLQGMTAQYLLRRTYRVQAGDVILLHAAAGGVGLIMVQWARHLGATVIGTVGNDEKAELVAAHGCHHVITYTRENFTERVRDITDGQGVAVVYDSVGKDTFMDSLDCLQPMGMMVSFGNASGPVSTFDPAILAAKGSLFLTRPTLMTYTAKRADLVAGATELFEVVRQGVVKIEVHQSYPLSDAEQAHRDLEARKTTGSTVLLP